MRVLHVHNEIEAKGGTEVYISELINLLPQVGYNTWWMAIQPAEDLTRWCLAGEEWKTGTQMAMKRNVLNWINDNAIDIICIHNIFDSDLADALVQCRPTIKFSHSPVVVCPGKDKYWRYSNTACTVPYGLHCFYHAYSQGCTNRHPKRLLHDFHFVNNELERARTSYKKVIVMSQYSCDRLMECGVPREKVSINPYFTRPSELKNNVVGNEQRLLFIGRLVEGKGVSFMLRAVQDILREKSGVTLDIIGDGPLLSELKRTVSQMELDSSVRFHGWLARDEIQFYLESCYLVVFPSVYPESFGIVGIEALMAGKPVVGFDVGGVSTWLKHGENGFATIPKDFKSMEVLIRRLIDDKKLYETLSKNARRHALENFLPQKHLQLLDEAFSDSVAEPKENKFVSPK